MATEQRFLRDLVLDQMLRELRDIQSRSEIDHKVSTRNMDRIVEAAIDLFETTRIVLEHIEAAIESTRKDTNQPKQLEDLIVAAAHLRMGITAMHTALVETTDTPPLEVEEKSENPT